jgi:hypothetical protein
MGIAIGFCRPTTSIAMAIATPIPMPIFSAVYLYFRSSDHCGFFERVDSVACPRQDAMSLERCQQLGFLFR